MMVLVPLMCGSSIACLNRRYALQPLNICSHKPNVQGHDVYLVAPVDNESGQGGRAVFTTEPTLTRPSEFDLIPKGAPSFGTDPADSHIWYYNGTPAAVTFFALDYVVPRYTGWKNVDLLVSGPNFGTNLGPFLYTISGTIGATYVSFFFVPPGLF